MTSNTEQPNQTPCYSDYALQEFALERHSMELREKIEVHISTCASCSSILEEVRHEINYFRHLTALDIDNSEARIHDSHTGERPEYESPHTSRDAAVGTQCPDSFELASYIDKSDEDDSRETVEAHIATCAACRHELITIYREVRGISVELAQRESLSPPSNEPPAEIFVLEIPKRPAPDPARKLPIYPLKSTGTSP